MLVPGEANRREAVHPHEGTATRFPAALNCHAKADGLRPPVSLIGLSTVPSPRARMIEDQDRPSRVSLAGGSPFETVLIFRVAARSRFFGEAEVLVFSVE
jgi:hypothetical protein